jgi:DNA-binding NtrC family response regulator
MKDILVVEHDERSREFLASCVASKGLAVESSADLAKASQALESGTFRLIITSLKLPDGDGVEILRKVQSANHGADVIVITGQGNVETAIECIKQGAVDFLLKPLSKTRLETLVDRTLERQDLIAEATSLRKKLEQAVINGVNGETLPEDPPGYLLNGLDSAALAGSSLKPLDQVEKEYILFALGLCDGNRSKAAKLLGIDRGTLARKLRRSRLAEENQAGLHGAQQPASLEL